MTTRMHPEMMTTPATLLASTRSKQMSQTNSTATATRTNATTRNAREKVVYVPPASLSESPMDTAERLREVATANHEQFVVKGRTAMLALMGDIYRLYCETKGRLDKGESFMLELKAKLKKLNVEVRKSSPQSSQLIRYICKDLDDKQISIYSRSLVVALKNGISVDGFIAFIEETKGGFSGVRYNETPGTTASKVGIGEQVAVAHVRAEKTLTTLHEVDWEDDEEYQVLIALRNDDDSAIVKSARLCMESLKTVMARYEADRRERNKPTQDEEAATNKIALQEMELELANAQTKLGNFQAELSKVIAGGNSTSSERLRVNLKVAEMQAKSMEKSYKAFKASLAKSEPA
jgi:hypothetical protein